MSHNQKICVIDDDSSIRWVLDKALGNAGLQVDLYESADNALAAIKQQEPAVIVTDIRMPGMDGLATPTWTVPFLLTRVVLSSTCLNRLMLMTRLHW